MFQRHPIQHQHMMFVTTNTLQRIPIFADPACARAAVEALYFTQERHPFFLYGFVVMPDHCHLLLHVREESGISTVMRDYKRRVAFSIGRGPIWQSRFHLEIPKDAKATLEYIHQNPVRKQLCALPEVYPWSSACGKWDTKEWEF